MTRLAEVKLERDEARQDLCRTQLALYDILNEKYVDKRSVRLIDGDRVTIYLTRVTTDPVVIMHYQPGSVDVLPVDVAIARVIGWSWSPERTRLLNALSELRGVAHAV